jgi:hypothetical protein
VVRISILFVLPLLPGCFIPDFDRTSGDLGGLISLGAEPAQWTNAHLFRVDTTEVSDWTFSVFDPRGESNSHEKLLLSEVPFLTVGGIGEARVVTPTQKAKGGWSSYRWTTGLYFNAHEVGRSFSLAIYRPGFKLTWNPSESNLPIDWKPAEDLWAQLEVLDELYFPGRLQAVPGGPPHELWLNIPLEPGSASVAHRKALLFGSSEYERLASIVMTQPELWRDKRSSPNPRYGRWSGAGPWDQPQWLQHLQEKSKKLRELADQ